MFEYLRNYIRRSEMLSDARRWMLYYGSHAVSESYSNDMREREKRQRDFYIHKVLQLEIKGLTRTQLDAIEMGFDKDQPLLSMIGKMANA